MLNVCWLQERRQRLSVGDNWKFSAENDLGSRFPASQSLRCSEVS